MNKKIFPLKKYKGQPMEVVLQDRNYCDWLIMQGWFKEKFQPYYQIIINNFGEPSETPEHNKLQNRFLDDNFCFALGKLCKWNLMKKNNCIYNLEEAIRNSLKKQEHNRAERLRSYKNYISESVYERDGLELNEFGEPYLKLKKLFEEDDWDIIIQTDDTECKEACLAFKECYIHKDKIAIEVKPIIGDDYPAILRKMKIARIHPNFQCLIYERFEAVGATIEQVKAIFESSGFLIFSFAEIESARNII